MSAPDKSMWARQLASTVRQGRKITVSILDEDQVEGYLAGMDEDTIFLLEPRDDGTFLKLLINRANILFIHLQDEKTFMEEQCYDDMAPVLRSFKDYVNKTYFPPERNEPLASTTGRRSSPYRGGE